MATQWQEQFFDDKKGNSSQMLAKTPLGWTLIGSPTYLIKNRQNYRNKRRRRKRNRNRNRRRRSFQQHVAYTRGSPVFMSSDSPRHGKTPEETPSEEVIENSPQENDEWDELEAMSRDEEEFMRKTVPYILSCRATCGATRFSKICVAPHYRNVAIVAPHFFTL